MSPIKSVSKRVLVCLSLWLAAIPTLLPAASVNDSTEAPVPVAIIHAAPLPTQDMLVTIGRLEAGDEIDLSFKTGGVIEKVLVDIGDPVTPGQILARLDTTEISADVRRAEENLGKTERDLVRAQTLHAQGLVAQEMLDNARTARDIAQAAVDAARFNLSHATLAAPAHGRVLARRVKGREIVGPGIPVLTVSSEGNGWLLKVSVSDRASVRMTPGLPVHVRLDAYPADTLAGSVRRVAGQADPATGMFDVDIGLSPTGQALRSGMIGRAAIVMPRKPVLGIPLTALIKAEGANATVIVVQGDITRERAITIGEMVGQSVEVLQGLTPEDAVVSSGGAYVNPGQRVILSRH